MYSQIDKNAIGQVSRSSSKYPKLLNKVSDAPDPLYFLGNYKKEIFENTLAVVGSRAVTMYGEWVIKNIVKEVARYGITIVSGFMYGVDALSHKAALEAKGSTIAVMAGGICKIFPSYQEDLYHDIVKSGLVVSEYQEKGAEGKWMFARRNRIVAGLSHAVLVIEAAESSGSLITAGLAKQYGRQLLTVPGNLNSKNAYGTTQLLKDGAKLVSCADDILDVFFGSPDNYRQNISLAVNKRLLLTGEGYGQTIQEELYLEPLSADELARKLGITVANVLKTATGLLVEGVISEKDGRYYAN